MATNDDGSARKPDESDMLPDDAAVQPERGNRLGDIDDEVLLWTAEAADRLDIDLD